MDESHPKFNAPLWKYKLSIWAAIALFGGLGLTPFSVSFLLTGFAVASFLATTAVLIHLFAIAQIQLLEFVLLIALIGNVLGWIYQFSALGLTGRAEDKIVYYLLTSCGITSIIVWAMCKGLDLVQRLKLKTPLKRLSVIALVLIWPFARISAPASILALLICAMNGDLRSSMISIMVFAAAFVVLFKYSKLRQRADEMNQPPIILDKVTSK